MADASALARDLARCVGERAIVSADDFARYEMGERYGHGRARAVIRPASTDEVAAIVRYCQARDIRILPQGANSGLVGASTPDESGEQLVLSLERLRGVEALDKADRSARVAAGTRLGEVNALAADAGLFFPIDLGADPTIGGMIATNTGGARLIRYGDVQRNLLGLEVVVADADATVLSDMRGLRKDNSGVDLKQLFVGSGGSFGIVTRAQIELHRIPRQTATAIIVPVEHGAIPDILEAIEQDAGEFLVACEGMSRNALAAALKHQRRLRNPFAPGALPDYVLLVELATVLPDDVVDLDELLFGILARSMEVARPLITDVRVGRGDEFWALRHSISEGLKNEGRIIAFDIAVPRSRLPAFRTGMIAEIEKDFPFLRICDFGHAGDGGDHFNLLWPFDANELYDDVIVAAVRERVYDCVVHRHGGTFSAEHGVGPYNLAYYRRYTDPAERATAARLKALFDPRGILGSVDLS